MTNAYTIINAIANCTTAISSIGLLIHIFGDPTNSIWDNKVKAWLAKTGLTVVICGATLNVLTLSTPSITEVLHNCGMSFTFFWLSWWQFEQFREKMASVKKTTVKETSVKRKRKPPVKKNIKLGVDNRKK